MKTSSIALIACLFSLNTVMAETIHCIGESFGGKTTTITIKTQKNKSTGEMTLVKSLDIKVEQNSFEFEYAGGSLSRVYRTSENPIEINTLGFEFINEGDAFLYTNSESGEDVEFSYGEDDNYESKMKLDFVAYRGDLNLPIDYSTPMVLIQYDSFDFMTEYSLDLDKLYTKLYNEDREFGLFKNHKRRMIVYNEAHETFLSYYDPLCGVAKSK